MGLRRGEGKRALGLQSYRVELKYARILELRAELGASIVPGGIEMAYLETQRGAGALLQSYRVELKLSCAALPLPAP